MFDVTFCFVLGLSDFINVLITSASFVGVFGRALASFFMAFPLTCVFLKAGCPSLSFKTFFLSLYSLFLSLSFTWFASFCSSVKTVSCLFIFFLSLYHLLLFYSFFLHLNLQCLHFHSAFDKGGLFSRFDVGAIL